MHESITKMAVNCGAMTGQIKISAAVIRRIADRIEAANQKTTRKHLADMLRIEADSLEKSLNIMTVDALARRDF